MSKFDEVLDLLSDVLKEGVGSDKTMKKWNRNYFSNARKRYRQELDMMAPYLVDGVKILEVGSAPFHQTFVLNRLGYNIVGVDVAPERFSDFTSTHKIQTVKCDIEKEQLPFDDGSYDLIIFNEVFEHMRIDPISTLGELNRVLKKGGVLMLSTPNLYSIQNLVRIALGRGFDNPFEEFNKLHEIGHMGHVREYSVTQVKQFLQHTGFKPVKVYLKSYNRLRGMWTPFNLVRGMIKSMHTFQIIFSVKDDK